jgi:hypothetical protein
MSIANHRRLMTKALVSTAIAFAACVGVAAPANADANSVGAAPNPFSTLSCNCQHAPAGSPVPRENIDRGIRDGLSAPLPGLPASTQPGQTRP